MRLANAESNQSDIAKKLGVSQYAIYSIESGKNKNPSLSTVLAYLTTFRISLFEFVDKKTSEKLLNTFMIDLVDNSVISMDTAAKMKDYFRSKF